MKNNLLKVAFICVHNSCRSQMAEAIAKEMNCTPKVGHKTTFGGAVFL